MKYIKDMKDGDRVSDIYLCKSRHSAVTRNGKAYDNVTILDKTGSMDAKVWEPNSAGIEDYDVLDFIEVFGDVSTFTNRREKFLKIGCFLLCGLYLGFGFEDELLYFALFFLVI